MKLALLNTTIATSDGWIRRQTISHNDAVAMVAKALQGAGIDSYVGHPATVQIVSALLGIDLPPSTRNTFSQQPGQSALCFRLKGRLAEGQVLVTMEEIEAFGFEWVLIDMPRVEVQNHIDATNY